MPMARLSVNVNKVATLRNSRGGEIPSVIEAVRVCLAAGALGLRRWFSHPPLPFGIRIADRPRLLTANNLDSDGSYREPTTLLLNVDLGFGRLVFGRLLLLQNV